MLARAKTEDLRVLVVAPLGRDAALICETLSESGIPGVPLRTVDALLREMVAGAGAAVIAEESLTPEAISAIAELLARQPAWSDFPFVILTTGGASTDTTNHAAAVREPLGNLTLIERPVRTVTLISAVRAVLRARQRQYDMRDELQARQQAQQALHASEARYRSLVNATTTIVLCADRDGCINAPSPAWEEFTGQAFAEYKDWGWADAIDPEDRERVVRSFVVALKSDQVFTAEFRLRHRDSYHRVLMRAVPVRTDDGSVREWVASCTDIEEQRAAQEALIKSEKLAVAGRLAASIAHEINNPLEAVTNLLYLISHSGSLEEIREFTKMAQSELERVSHIATQTLRFYRQPSGATPTDVAELVDSVLALFQRRIQSSHIRLQTEFATSRPLVCYPGEVRQMVANLVGNAVDAMRAGGGLRLRVRECTDANRARGVAIVVADSGTGIPDSLRPRLFEPFMTTKGITGTGLGLWVTRELVQKHKGTVRVRSSTRTGASGTVFRIFLPYDAVEEKAPAAEAATATELRRGA